MKPQRNSALVNPEGYRAMCGFDRYAPSGGPAHSLIEQIMIRASLMNS